MNIGRGRAILKARLRFPWIPRIFGDACRAGRFDWRLWRRRDLEIGELGLCDTSPDRRQPFPSPPATSAARQQREAKNSYWIV